MRILAAYAIVLVLSGCAGISPLSDQGADGVKKGKAVVLFSDDVGQINYLEDMYYVLAVTQEASNSVYRSLWDSGKDLSALTTSEFGKLGLNAVSGYDALTEEEIQRLDSERAKFAFQPQQQFDKATSVPPAISDSLKDLLTTKGNDYLIWANWSGFLLHIQTLGLPARVNSTVAYRIIDLRRNEVIGGALVGYNEKIDLGDSTAKQVLEKDDLAGLKAKAAEIIRTGFDPARGKSSVGEATGLVPPSKPAPSSRRKKDAK